MAKRNWKIGLKQLKKPVPPKWSLISRVLKFIFGALIPIFSGTTLFESRTSDIVIFFMGIGIVILSALDMLLGVAEGDAYIPVHQHRAGRAGGHEEILEDNSDKI